jgi:catechol 2,3-dioxygenase-like lactoylglutathione lyase family enzyme
MKRFFLPLIFLSASFIAVAQTGPTPGEFRSPSISIGVVVEDLDKSLEFYTEVIGMKKTGSFSVDEEKARDLGLTKGRSLSVTVLKLEDSPQASEWKLMSFETKSQHKKQKYIDDDTGMQYITIFVNHLKPIIKRVKENDVKILSGKPSDLGNGNYFILVQDPDGTFIELIGPE